MRPRRANPDDVTEAARRRLELLAAELALLRPVSPVPGESADDAERLSLVPAGGEAGGADVRHTWTVVAGDDGPDPGSVGPGKGESAEGGPGEGASAPAGRHARRPVSATGRLGGWVHDRLPGTLQGRVGLSPGNLAVVALLVAAGCALTAWWVVRADGAGEVVPPASWGVEAGEEAATPGTAPGAAPGTAAGTVPGAAADPAAQEVGVGTPGGDPAAGGVAAPGVVVVDVTGKVRHRGIVTLPVGSRVVDALEAAGGPRRGVRTTTLNLARVLVDGEQIVVGVPPPGGIAAAASSAATGPAAPGGVAGPPLVNINTAGQAELEELPGVGPVTAEAILSWRSENGAFSSVDELLEVSGIGDKTLADIAPHVTL